MKFAPVALCLLCTGVAPIATAEKDWNEALSDAVTNGTASLNFRYRYEYVDQDGFDDEARASLMLSRLTLTTADLAGFSAQFQVDNVTSIGDNDYNSTENGKTQYPTVADPEGTEVNQAWLKYSGQGVTATGGRQRITLGNRRIVGNKPWRNNEQTYDGARLEWSPLDALSIDVSYVYQVNRIFGPDDGANPADWEGDSFFLHSEYRLAEAHKISAFGYRLEVDEQGRFSAGKTVNNSSDTYGLEYAGTLDWLQVRASWATQSEAGDSELDYDADYYVLQLGAKLRSLEFKAAYEVLAADNGVGFSTPLANGHAFQGWADKFIATPGDGIEDAWVSVSGAIGPVQLTGRYHDFQAESSSADFGSEIDLQARWTVVPEFTATLKAALFDSDDADRYDDTDKIWLMLQLKL